ncbi:MAG: hypothetical protein ABFD79_12045 [Phycisphaerales bacterium]
MSEHNPINRVDRSKAALKHNFEEDDFVDASPEECLDFMWELTKDVWSLSGSQDAEKPMQKHIAILRKIKY